MAKKILRSVGRGGVNSREDAMTVQYLLNCVPMNQGGPRVELAIDGLCGPKTVKAIETFQMRWFSIVDGRVDPNGQTMRALLTYDPAPHHQLPAAGTHGTKSAGHSPAGVPGSKSAGVGTKSGMPGGDSKNAFGPDPFHPEAKQGSHAAETKQGFGSKGF